MSVSLATVPIICADTRDIPPLPSVLAASQLWLVQGQPKPCIVADHLPSTTIFAKLTDKNAGSYEAHDFFLDRNAKSYKSHVFKLPAGYDFDAVIDVDPGVVPKSYTITLTNTKVGAQDPPPASFIYHLNWGPSYNKNFHLNGIDQCKVKVNEDVDYDNIQPSMTIYQTF